ncbi:hypothetical protein [Ruegeria sp. EL01]|uniref:hypothetical protein n=1 Tax=Ruegeria sp. EL01 TaxID=2107578 RepID=UPI001C1F2F30|nr:hypothetical protein [Ruegeria sp. EL01]
MPAYGRTLPCAKSCQEIFPTFAALRPNWRNADFAVVGFSYFAYAALVRTCGGASAAPQRMSPKRPSISRFRMPASAYYQLCSGLLSAVKYFAERVFLRSHHIELHRQLSNTSKGTTQ